MDVNGTRFHLFQGRQDWCRCRLPAQPDRVDDWCTNLASGEDDAWIDLAYDDRSDYLAMRPLLTLFPRGRRDVPLTPANRRGAAVDRFGNWYWISRDQRHLVWLPAGGDKPAVYWTQASEPGPRQPGAFGPAAPAAAIAARLAGLAVTEHHVLVVGNASRGGLFLFDLHAGGPPTLLLFPPALDVTPFDLAAAPGGGVWVLDRVNRVYWGFSRTFQLFAEPAALADSPPAGDAFRPASGPTVVRPTRRFPAGFALADAADPCAVAGLPDGSVLILDNPVGASPGPSTILHYRLDERLSPPLPLEDEVTVVRAGEGQIRTHLSVSGQDMAYSPADETVYVVERDGNQAIAFRLVLDGSPPYLTVERDYLPMHFYGGRALVAAGDHIYYDVSGASGADRVTRWARLQTVPQPRFGRAATIDTPVLDGREQDCVWHRLFLDACIPREATVAVWTRAHNRADLLSSVPYQREPDLYLRGSGAEIALHRPFRGSDSAPEGAGTWEVLLQAAHGRYCQVRLTLLGNGRVTPQVRSLRVYYPRFSYPQRYLPAVFHDGQPGTLIERLLANMEGFYSEIEGRMVQADALFDARTAPPEALDWLAGWLGLLLDPLWGRLQKERDAGSGREDDRRRLFIRFARLLYERRGTVDGIRFALHLLLEPCLEAALARFKQAAVRPAAALHDELARYGLASPTPVTSDSGLEDLLHAYVLRRPARIRIVERFLTRGNRALVAGDPTRPNQSPAPAGPADAHRFAVLIPTGLTAAEERMVSRIVQLEKPAHTAFEVRRYWDGFRIGEARLGLDSTLEEVTRFVPTVLGRHHLADSYLAAAHPTGEPDRFIVDRDRLGGLPPL